MKFLTKAGAIFDRINEYLFWLAGILLAFAWFSDCYEVVMRYFLSRPTKWAMEASENILVWVTYLCAAWILRNDAHIKIDFVVVRLKSRVQIIIRSFTYALCALVCLAIFWYGLQVVQHQFQEHLVSPTLLALPLGPLHTIIPLSGLLLFIQFLRKIYSLAINWRVPPKLEEAEEVRL